jgi:hypothetical protein
MIMNSRIWIGAAMVVAAAFMALPSATASAAMPFAKPATGADARHAVRWKRAHGKRVHAARGYNKGWKYKRYWGSYGQYDYGSYYVRPKPYTYIYRYQPYVYHRPRVYIRPEPRSAHRQRYWPRETWRKRYDRRPGVYYYHR